MYPNTDLPGVGDFSCDPGDTACFRGGTIQKVASECTKMTDCKGFVTTDKSNSRGVGGFLKNKVEPRQKSQGLDLYVSTSAGEGLSCLANVACFCFGLPCRPQQGPAEAIG